MDASERDTLVYKAKLAEQAERYSEMKEYMSLVAQDKSDSSLSIEERNLLSVAFKNVIGSRRASWRVIQSITDSETESERKDILKEYRVVIETEIEDICGQILEIITQLIEKSRDTEPKVFYLKMKGDYLRYLAEFQVDEKKKNKCRRSEHSVWRSKSTCCRCRQWITTNGSNSFRSCIKLFCLSL